MDIDDLSNFLELQLPKLLNTIGENFLAEIITLINKSNVSPHTKFKLIKTILSELAEFVEVNDVTLGETKLKFNFLYSRTVEVHIQFNNKSDDNKFVELCEISYFLKIPTDFSSLIKEL